MLKTFTLSSSRESNGNQIYSREHFNELVKIGFLQTLLYIRVWGYMQATTLRESIFSAYIVLATF